MRSVVTGVIIINCSSKPQVRTKNIYSHWYYYRPLLYRNYVDSVNNYNNGAVPSSQCWLLNTTAAKRILYIIHTSCYPNRYPHVHASRRPLKLFTINTRYLFLCFLPVCFAHVATVNGTRSPSKFRAIQLTHQIYLYLVHWTYDTRERLSSTLPPHPRPHGIHLFSLLILRRLHSHL